MEQQTINKMKAIIYNRTSTKEQNPELQQKDCVEFCKSKGQEVVDIKAEQGSAYKLDKRRPVWESVIERAKREKLNIVVWRYDRAFRNRKEFYEFMKIMFEVYGVKVYSATEPSIISLWELMDKQNISDPVQSELISGVLKVIWNFLIQQAGEEAEEESRKKSGRVKLAVVREDKEGNKIKTESYKGNAWGRKPLSQEVINKVIELKKQGNSIRQISSQVTYWDKNNNQKHISVAGVHKLLKQFSREQPIV